MSTQPTERKPVSIGRLATETGISTERLRIWERRYGSPAPIRLPSGHRRYPWDQVLRMRRVSDLIARGAKPGSLLRLSTEELETRFGSTAPLGDGFPGEGELLASIRDLDAEGLRAGLLAQARQLPLLDFLDGRAAPLMREVGLRWSDGRLEIRHEHLAARVVSSVLDELRPVSRGTTGSVVLATLPGERHGLALRMLGLVCLANDFRTHELDVDVPTAQIARAAAETGASLVAVSVSSANHLHDSFRDLRELHTRLPEGCTLLVGGAGATRGQRGPRGVHVFRDLAGFESWLGKARRALQPRAPRVDGDAAQARA